MLVAQICANVIDRNPATMDGSIGCVCFATGARTSTIVRDPECREASIIIETHYFSGVVDHEGEILESDVTKERDELAALQFFKKTL